MDFYKAYKNVVISSDFVEFLSLPVLMRGGLLYIDFCRPV